MPRSNRLNRSWKDSPEVPPLKPIMDFIGVDILGLYWFWDEVGTQAFGPFYTLAECEMALEAYGKSLDRKYDLSSHRS